MLSDILFSFLILIIMMLTHEATHVYLLRKNKIPYKKVFNLKEWSVSWNHNLLSKEANKKIYSIAIIVGVIPIILSNWLLSINSFYMMFIILILYFFGCYHDLKMLKK